MALTEITEFTESKKSLFYPPRRIKPILSSFFSVSSAYSSERVRKQSAVLSCAGFSRLVAIIFVVLLLLGAAVRIYGAWQLRHNLNPDSGIVALMARHIAEGVDFPVFFYGQAYMGALEPFISALFCILFGTSGFMVTLGTAFAGWLILLAVYLWARDAHSPLAGLAAMAFCVMGPLAFVHYGVSPRGGYNITILLGTLILWLGSKLIGESVATSGNFKTLNIQRSTSNLERRDATRRNQGSMLKVQRWMLKIAALLSNSNCAKWFLLGLLAGLGWWSNQLIVYAILTAAVMALLFLRGKVISLNTIAAAIGFFAGSLPFWWWNFYHDWQSFEFTGSIGRTPFQQGIRIFFVDRFPDLLDLNQGLGAWRIISATVYIGAAAWVFFIMLRLMKEPKNRRWIYLLTLFVFVVISALLFSTSHFALMNTSRYLLPLVPAVAVILGVATAELVKKIPAYFALIPLALLIVPQTGGMRAMAQRGAGEKEYQRQIEKCGRFLESQGINICYAPYGKYSWNFALNEKICFCDLPQDRYPPYVRRAELADRIAVFDNLGHINDFIAGYGGNAKTVYSGETPICFDFNPPGEGLTNILPAEIDSIHDSLGRDALLEITDGNIDTGWDSVVADGDAEWLEIDFKTPQTVRMIRLLFYEYPEAWQIAGQGDDRIWKTLSLWVPTAGYIWSGPRPYWSYGLEGYRLECRIPPQKLKRLRIHRIESGYRLFEMQLFAPAPAPESEYSDLKSLVDLIRQRKLNRLYCDRWPANAVFRETQGAVETSLNPGIFGDSSLSSSNAVWFTPRTGILVRREDAPLCRQILVDRLLAMRQTQVGPWILFDFEPGKWQPEYGRDCELHWTGFACLARNNKRWAAELVSRADIQVAQGAAGAAIALLQKASAAWPLYPPAVERLAEISVENFKEVGPHSLCGRPNRRNMAGQGCPALPTGQLSNSAGYDLSEAEYWRREYDQLQPHIKAAIKFNNGIEFAGLSLSTNIVPAGEALTVQYYWKYPADEIDGKPWIFVHFLNGENILQDDHPLEKFKGAEYQPFPEIFVETRRLLVPKAAPEGEYQIRIGLYDASRTDQKRVAVKTELPSRLHAAELPVKLTIIKRK